MLSSITLLARRCGRYKEPVAVTSGETADDAGIANGGVYYGDYVAELGFEGGI
jgi:hypothetical protein